MSITHIAYLIMLGVAWTWGLSQVRYAMLGGRFWPPPWRLTAGFWLSAKAGFLSYLGWAVWDVMDSWWGHRMVVIVFAAIHAAAFAQWATLPGDKPVPEPPIEAGGAS